VKVKDTKNRKPIFNYTGKNDEEKSLKRYF